jgi:hypothetical protein
LPGHYCKIYNAGYSTATIMQTISALNDNLLANLMERYAQGIFSDEIRKYINYKQFFNNIQQRYLVKAADVIMNGKYNDLMVMGNHRFYFKEIICDYIEHSPPVHISTPLLISSY